MGRGRADRRGDPLPLRASRIALDVRGSGAPLRVRINALPLSLIPDLRDGQAPGGILVYAESARPCLFPVEPAFECGCAAAECAHRVVSALARESTGAAQLSDLGAAMAETLRIARSPGLLVAYGPERVPFLAASCVYGTPFFRHVIALRTHTAPLQLVRTHSHGSMPCACGAHACALTRLVTSLREPATALWEESQSISAPMLIQSHGRAPLGGDPPADISWSPSKASMGGVRLQVSVDGLTLARWDASDLHCELCLSRRCWHASMA